MDTTYAEMMAQAELGPLYLRRNNGRSTTRRLRHALTAIAINRHSQKLAEEARRTKKVASNKKVHVSASRFEAQVLERVNKTAVTEEAIAKAKKSRKHRR